jgi:hypothetical protein
MPQYTEPVLIDYCQHPGSPGLPQQTLKLRSLSVLFFMSSEIFLVTGMGFKRLPKTALTSGFFFFEHI